jgi:hypothetical protein
MPRIRKIPREPKVGNLELPVRGDEEVVRLQVAVQHEAAVAELEPAQGHRHPALRVRGEEDERAVFDDHLEVAVEELEHEVEVLF